MVGIYEVMYTVHYENTLRIEAIECINIEHLIDFGVYALVGCTNYIILQKTFKRYFKCILGVQI